MNPYTGIPVVFLSFLHLLGVPSSSVEKIVTKERELSLSSSYTSLVATPMILSDVLLSETVDCVGYTTDN